MIKEFVECSEECLLVGSVEFSEEGRVIRCAFLFNQASTNFALLVISRLVTLLLISSTKWSCLGIFLVHPSRVSVILRSHLLGRGILVERLEDCIIEVREIILESGGGAKLKRSKGLREASGKSCVVQVVNQSRLGRRNPSADSLVAYICSFAYWIPFAYASSPLLKLSWHNPDVFFYFCTKFWYILLWTN